MDKFSVSTIGFTKTSAEKFFSRLIDAKITKVIDVRLNNKSQLAGFAKSIDLAFFLKKIGSIDYVHLGLLAPDEAMLSAFKKDKGDWNVYAGRFLELMKQRRIESRLRPEMFDRTCLLCSEDTPHQCHRRLVLEYLNKHWDNKLTVRHL